MGTFQEYVNICKLELGSNNFAKCHNDAYNSLKTCVFDQANLWNPSSHQTPDLHATNTQAKMPTNHNTQLLTHYTRDSCNVVHVWWIIYIGGSIMCDICKATVQYDRWSSSRNSSNWLNFVGCKSPSKHTYTQHVASMMHRITLTLPTEYVCARSIHMLLITAGRQLCHRCTSC